MLIQLQSMSEAVRLWRALGEKGIRAEVRQTPASMRRGGCGYSVRLPENALSVAEMTAQKMGLHILGIDGSGGG